ncbi:MAG TPA: hypothetical protein VGJ86_01550, partial [Acidimicrobiales bacterium]
MRVGPSRRRKAASILRCPTSRLAIRRRLCGALVTALVASGVVLARPPATALANSDRPHRASSSGAATRDRSRDVADLRALTARLYGAAGAIAASPSRGPLLRAKLASVAVRRIVLLLSLTDGDPQAVADGLLSAADQATLTAAGIPTEHRRTMTGLVRITHRDDLAHHTGWFRQALVGSHGRALATLKSNHPLPASNGHPVTVSGDLIGNTLFVAGAPGSSMAQMQVQTDQPGSPPSVGSVTMAVIVVDFSDTGTPYPVSSLQSMYTESGGIIDYFTESSYGAMTLAPSFFGPYTMVEDTSTGCANETATRAEAVAASGIAVAGYSRVSVVLNCGWTAPAGLAIGPCPLVPSIYNYCGYIIDGNLDFSVNGLQAETHRHEISHTLGNFNWHSSADLCYPEVFVAPPTGCPVDEYRDATDVLGASREGFLV